MASRLSQGAEEEVRSEVVKALGPAYASISSQTIARFYRATGGKPKSTIKRLVDTLKWRETAEPHLRECTACASNPRAHYLHPVGWDRLGRPVLFSNYMLIEVSDAAATTEHMMVEFERAVSLMGPGVESWVWVLDFRGYGRRAADLNPALAINFLEMSASHYPERLGQLLVVDAPAILTPVWNMLRPMIDPVTYEKFRFLPYDVKKDKAVPASVQQLQGANSQAGSSAGVGAEDDDEDESVIETGDAELSDTIQGSSSARTSAEGAPASTAVAITSAAVEPHVSSADASDQGSKQAAAGGSSGAQDGPPAAGGVTVGPAAAGGRARSKLRSTLESLFEPELSEWFLTEFRVTRAWGKSSRRGRRQGTSSSTGNAGGGSWSLMSALGLGGGGNSSSSSNGAAAPPSSQPTNNTAEGAAGAAEGGNSSGASKSSGPVAQRPEYDLKVLRDLALSGKLAQMASDPNLGHSHYGTRSLLAHFAAHPDKLWPPGAPPSVPAKATGDAHSGEV